MPRLRCLTCFERTGVLKPATQVRDPWGNLSDARCAECWDAAAEAQMEADFAEFHGSNTPTNDAERDAVQGRRPR